MSLFRVSDYTGKKQNTYSSKTKLPTQNKTRKHKCSQCERRDAVSHPISEKETRWLCPEHIVKFNAQFSKENIVSFVRGSQLL